MAQNNGSVLPGIDTIVVLMLENRSFDNILGWLYDSNNAYPFQQVPPGQTFNGVSGKGLRNPWNTQPPALVPVGSTTDPINPNPDPGEVYADVYQQLYNPVPPLPKNQIPPPNPPQPPPMAGFVNNYAAQHKTHPPSIMLGFRPPTLPWLCYLAYEYVVCDSWFASVPSQTLTNRSFVHAGTASGYVNNRVGLLPIFENHTDTIFNLLEAQKQSWGIYYGSHWFFCNAWLCQSKLDPYMFSFPGPQRIHPFSQFLAQAQSGQLPKYSFIEPNFMDSIEYGRENDMHPHAGLLDIDGKPSDVRFGDDLVRRVYQALTGPRSKWQSTLLVITFDEHGGCYDHVAPGSATPPDNRIIPPGQDGYSGFGFNRYGVRVPTVLISPWLQLHAVDHTVYDHTSIIKTVMGQFLKVQGNELGNRVAAANPLNPPAGTLRSYLSGLPAAPEPAVPLASAEETLSDSPLTDFQASMVEAAYQRLQQLGATAPVAEALAEPQLETTLHAEQKLLRLAATLPKSKKP
jgi:phospholipase C